MSTAYLQQHRAHDYRQLVRRWKRVARSARLKLQLLCEADGYPIYHLRTKPFQQRGGNGCIYISSGIHGDEPASTEGLIAWLEQKPEILTELPLLLLPCLNPWGLVNNTRHDGTGRDLNRIFMEADDGLVDLLKKLLAGMRFDLAITLHEDYDAQGIYLYEVHKQLPAWGADLLKKLGRTIPVEGRTTIDGRRHQSGIIRRRFRKWALPWLPEAVYLHMHHAERTFTFETPSEYGLDERVAAQQRFLTACMQRWKKECGAIQGAVG